MRKRRAPTCEKRVNLFRFAAQADVLFWEIHVLVKFFRILIEKKLQEHIFYDIIVKRFERRPCGQAVKTAPSHGAIPGSIPGKVTKQVKGEPVSIRRRIRL